jgi:hypothetical protein
MKKLWILLTFSLMQVSVAHAQTIPNDGSWVKIPVVLESKHPYPSGSYNSPALIYPVQFTGATALKFVVKKAEFDDRYYDETKLSIIDETGNEVQNIKSADTSTYVVQGDTAAISWKAYSNYSNYYGYAIDVYALIP